MHNGIIDADNHSYIKSLYNVHGQAVNMVDGKQGHGHGSRRYLHVQTDRIVRQVPVAQHDSLALSGGA